jgi:hypothetical protein
VLLLHRSAQIDAGSWSALQVQQLQALQIESAPQAECVLKLRNHSNATAQLVP